MRPKGVDLEAFYQFDLSDSSEMGLRLFATRTDEVVTVIAGQRTDYAGVTGQPPSPNPSGR